MSDGKSRVILAVLAVSLAFAVGCARQTSEPEKQRQATASTASSEPGPWHLDLKISPEHPRMIKPVTFALHITDDHAQPVTDAQVNGALTMKEMDMGTAQIKFAPKGNGNYEASMTSMDMSGHWNLAVDAWQGPVHTKRSFEFTVYD